MHVMFRTAESGQRRRTRASPSSEGLGQQYARRRTLAGGLGKRSEHASSSFGRGRARWDAFCAAASRTSQRGKRELGVAAGALAWPRPQARDRDQHGRELRAAAFSAAGIVPVKAGAGFFSASVARCRQPAGAAVSAKRGDPKRTVAHAARGPCDRPATRGGCPSRSDTVRELLQGIGDRAWQWVPGSPSPRAEATARR